MSFQRGKADGVSKLEAPVVVRSSHSVKGFIRQNREPARDDQQRCQSGDWCAVQSDKTNLGALTCDFARDRVTRDSACRPVSTRAVAVWVAVSGAGHGHVDPGEREVPAAAGPGREGIPSLARGGSFIILYEGRPLMRSEGKTPCRSPLGRRGLGVSMSPTVVA